MTGNYEFEKEKAKEIASEALDSLPKPKETFDQFLALHIAFRALVRGGLADEAKGIISEAFHITRTIERPDLRSSALAEVAGALFKVGLLNDATIAANEARSAAEHIPEDTLKSSALLGAARMLAKLRSYRAALETANLCSSSSHKLTAYTAILREYHIERNPTRAKLFVEED